MEAIILCGGLGTRLKTVIGNDLPKCMAPINNNKPFLSYLFDYLLKQGITRCILACGHLHEKILQHYGRQYQNMKLSYCIEHSLLGTGGAIANAIRKCVDDDIFILNGDSLFKCGMFKIMENHLKQRSKLTIGITKREMNYDMIKLYADSVVSYSKLALISAGIYILNKHSKIFTSFGNRPFLFENEFIKEYVSRGTLSVNAYYEDSYFIDIGTPENYYRSKLELD